MEHTCAKSVGTPSRFRTLISSLPFSALLFYWEVSDPVLCQPSALCSSFAKISTLVNWNHFYRSQLFFYVILLCIRSVTRKFPGKWRLLNDLETEIRPEFMKVRLLDQSLFFSIFFKFTVNWRIIALQCVLVSAIQHGESAVSIHISTPSWTSLPSHPTPPLVVITDHWSELPVLHSNFPLAVLHMVVYMFQWYSLSSSHPLLPLLFFPQVCSLLLHLCFCPESRFISTLFLDSIYMH